MHDMMTIDTMRELAARDERDQVALVGLGAAILQTQLVIMAALLARANEQARPIVVKRR